MKRWIAVLSAAVLCLSLANLLLAAALCLSLGTRDGKKGENTAASSDAPANIVVDGKEISAKDFLIEHLNAYIQSDEYWLEQQNLKKHPAGRLRPLL